MNWISYTDDFFLATANVRDDESIIIWSQQLLRGNNAYLITLLVVCLNITGKIFNSVWHK